MKKKIDINEKTEDMDVTYSYLDTVEEWKKDYRNLGTVLIVFGVFFPIFLIYMIVSR